MQRAWNRIYLAAFPNESSTRVLTACLVASALAAPWPTHAGTDADVLDLVDALRPVAQAIVVDGSDADWGAIPRYPDPVEGGDDTRDITETAVAPLDSEVLFLWKTDGAPSTADEVFLVFADLAGGANADFAFSLVPSTGAHKIELEDDRRQLRGSFTFCDDGNTSDGDSCSARCLVETCGNAGVDPGEECDDGNATAGDGCDASCMYDPHPSCGNGTVEPIIFIDTGGRLTILIEDCDDNNNTSGDGCSEVCKFEGCGSGTVDPGEECDDGNTMSGDGCDASCLYEAPAHCGDSDPNPGVEVSIGSTHGEARVAYSAFSNLLSPTHQAALTRPFMRGGIVSFDLVQTEVDRTVAGSYRLLATLPSLDPPLPVPPPGPPVEVRWPLAGEWFLLQGGYSTFSHFNYWAYDFARADHELDRSEPPDSTVNGDFYGYEEPLFSPVSGTVTASEGMKLDQTPPIPVPTLWNFIQLDFQDMESDFTMKLGHLRQGSLNTVVPPLEPHGQQLAQIGNSGFSGAPHLHLEVQNTVSQTQSVAFDHVVVALNAGGSDPWAREVTSWELREGFLISHAGMQDDFDDGDDDTGPNLWTHFGAGSFDASTGAYQLQATADPIPGTRGNVASYVAPAAYEDFVAAVDIVDFDGGLEQVFGIGARARDFGVSTTNGYGLGVVSSTIGDRIVLLRIDSGIASTINLAASGVFALSTANDYRLVFEGVRSSLSGALYQYPDLVTPIATVAAVDTTYWASGAISLFVANNEAPDYNSAGDVTFDDFLSAARTEDTDSDGLSDAFELGVGSGTDPLLFDTDGDNLSDGDEVDVHGTNPLLADTDGDGYSDAEEIWAGSDPLDEFSIPQPPAVPALPATGVALLVALLLGLGVVWLRRLSGAHA